MRIFTSPLHDTPAIGILFIIPQYDYSMYNTISKLFYKTTCQGNKNSYFPVVICFIISNPFEFSLHVNEKS